MLLWLQSLPICPHSASYNLSYWLGQPICHGVEGFSGDEHFMRLSSQRKEESQVTWAQLYFSKVHGFIPLQLVLRILWICSSQPCVLSDLSVLHNYVIAHLVCQGLGFRARCSLSARDHLDFRLLANCRQSWPFLPS